MKNKVIEVKDLNFENILKNISLEIFEGEFVAILGANGDKKYFYKTTFLGIYGTF
ncbi:MAG: hypothetical protein U5K55_04865 [Aliarcobacter sp.]|nr:hypothetical protein [Aliarcobacter sp.]